MEDEEHMHQVLQQLIEFGLYCKADKSQFGGSEVVFLRVVITPNGFSIESDWISTMENWPTPKSVKDGQGVLGFTIFYRRFFHKYVKLSFLLAELVKKSETSRSKKSECSIKSEWTREAMVVFRKVNRTLPETPILQHYDRSQLIILQMDATGFAIAGHFN